MAAASAPARGGDWYRVELGVANQNRFPVEANGEERVPQLVRRAGVCIIVRS